MGESKSPATELDLNNIINAAERERDKIVDFLGTAALGESVEQIPEKYRGLCITLVGASEFRILLTRLVMRLLRAQSTESHD